MSNVLEKEAMAQFGIVPNKALGQNFLTDKKAIERIVEAAEVTGKHVLEVGPGMGALTFDLLREAKSVVAVELDKKMVEYLNDKVSCDYSEFAERLTLINSDFLRVSNDDLIELLNSSFCVVANLPYYITTPICMKLMSFAGNIESMTLMLQKEAAERFFAKPSTKLYGPLTILADYMYDAETIMELSPSSYYPQPDVHSAVVMLKVKEFGSSVAVAMPKLLNVSFAMRRKTLVNNLISGGYSKGSVTEALETVGLSQSVRAEALRTSDFEALVKILCLENRLENSKHEE